MEPDWNKTSDYYCRCQQRVWTIGMMDYLPSCQVCSRCGTGPKGKPVSDHIPKVDWRNYFSSGELKIECKACGKILEGLEPKQEAIILEISKLEKELQDTEKLKSRLENNIRKLYSLRKS